MGASAPDAGEHGRPAGTAPQQLARLRVPFLDLAPAHRDLRASILEDIGALIDSGAFTNGPAVGAFEEAFAAATGAGDCVGVANGLDALRLALLALELEQGDEVLVPAHTFVASIEAITQAGGQPVLVDVGEDATIDPGAAAAAVGPRTRFLLPVHLYGQLADMHRLGELAAQNDLTVVEDACQAHGARRGGLRPGQAGHAAAFSFYPAKNLGAFGDAGALVTDDGEVASTVRLLREHGQARKYEHAREGYTARLDTLQALVLLRKLPLLDGWNAQRRRAAAYYLEALAGLEGLGLPGLAEGSEHVWHVFVVRVEHPDRLAAFLGERGIASGRHYPYPIHLTAAYRHLGAGPGSFPEAEALAREALSLPLYPGISEAQQELVVSAVREFLSHG